MGRVWLFRVIALAAIVFAAGHSGGFLNTQEGQVLGKYGWGVFGALVAGLALWGGIYVYAAYGQRSGLLVATVAAIADVVMGYGWFLTTATVAPLILALWPPLLALLAGLIEGGLSRELLAAERQEAHQAAELERELALKRLQGEQRLASRRLKLETQTSAPGQSANAGVAVPATPDPDKQLRDALESGATVTITSLAQATGMSRAWVHGKLASHGWTYDGQDWHGPNGHEME